MKHYNDEWIREWCRHNGWTDEFMESRDRYWAFPPGAVMPEPIPPSILRSIKAEKGLCAQERLWSAAAVVLTAIAIILSYATKSPMPLVLAFAFDAVAAAKLEVDDF